MPTTSVRVLWISLFFCFNFEPDCSQHINVLVKFEKLNDKHQATLNYCKIKMNKAQQLSIFFQNILRDLQMTQVCFHVCGDFRMVCPS